MKIKMASLNKPGMVEDQVTNVEKKCRTSSPWYSKQKQKLDNGNKETKKSDQTPD